MRPSSKRGLRLDRDKLLARFSVRLTPTWSECLRMLWELRSAVGGVGLWRLFALLGVPACVGRCWLEARRSEEHKRQAVQSTRRLIWLLWALICRPGSISTVWHITTCGRTTKDGNPATAGKRWRRRDDGSAADASMRDPALALALRFVLEEDERRRACSSAVNKSKRRIARILSQRRGQV